MMAKKLLFVYLFIVGCAASPSFITDQTNEIYRYDSVILEVQPSEIGLQDLSLELFRNKLDQYSICKKENISIIRREPIILINRRWTKTKLLDLQTKYRSVWDNDYADRHCKAWVIVVPGYYKHEDLKSVAGLKFINSSIAIFRRRDAVENSVILFHEFGHLMGLVDGQKRSEVPANKDRPDHCNDIQCIMFWKPHIYSYLCKQCKIDVLRFTLHSKYF